MYLVPYKNKWVVYGDDGKVIIISSDKRVCINYAKGKYNES